MLIALVIFNSHSAQIYLSKKGIHIQISTLSSSSPRLLDVWQILHCQVLDCANIFMWVECIDFLAKSLWEHNSFPLENYVLCLIGSPPLSTHEPKTGTYITLPKTKCINNYSLLFAASRSFETHLYLSPTAKLK